VGRASHVEAVTRGWDPHGLAGRVSSQSVRAARPTLADAGGPFDYVFLTVKGYDNAGTRSSSCNWCYVGHDPWQFFKMAWETTKPLPRHCPSRPAGRQPDCAVSLDERAPSSCIRGAAGWRSPPVSPEVNVAPLVRKMRDAGFKSAATPTFAR